MEASSACRGEQAGSGVTVREVSLKELSGMYQVAVLARKSEQIKYTKTIRPIGYVDPDEKKQATA